MSNRINITKEQKEMMLSKIKEYYIQERDEEVGDLAALLLLDFFLKELAPEIYNIGVKDSYLFMHEKIEDLFGLQIYKK